MLRKLKALRVEGVSLALLLQEGINHPLQFRCPDIEGAQLVHMAPSYVADEVYGLTLFFTREDYPETPVGCPPPYVNWEAFVPPSPTDIMPEGNI